MGFSIVITGNHFILDAVAGAVIVLAALTVCRWHQERTGTINSIERLNA